MEGTGQISVERAWPKEGSARIPYWVYQDPEVYALEQERIFSGPTWNYVGLEAEIPNPGDYRRTFIGERSVIVVRAADGAVRVLENRCAHRGARICQDLAGNAGAALVCPYHQWTYDFEGGLTGVPFRRGFKGKGGMPDDFRLEDNGLLRLRAEVLNGVVFATFDASAPSLADYLGPDMMRYFTRVFDGRALRILGTTRQRIDSNWKLQMENLKDPYHAGLLHMFLVSFGLFRLDQESIMVMDRTRGHSALLSRRSKAGEREGAEEVARFTADYRLEDARLIEPALEFDDDITLSIQTLFPSIIVQAQINTLAMRHVIPKGVGAHELVWTFFGYEDDDAERETLRLRQSNLMGPAGYVTLDDAEALEISQIGIDGASPDAAAVLDLGGRDAEPTDHLVTEALLRGFYELYRDLMGYA